MINQGSPRDFGVPHLPATPNYQSWRLVPSAHCSWWLLGVPRQGHLVISHSNGSHTAPFSSMFDDFFLSDFPELCLPEAMDFQNFLDLKWWYPEIWGWVKAYGFPSWMKNHILPASTSIYQLWPEVGCWQWTPEERWCTSGTTEGGTRNVPNLPWFGTTTQPFPPFDAELWDLIFSKISSNETPKMWTLDILRLTRNDMGFVEGFGTPWDTSDVSRWSEVNLAGWKRWWVWISAATAQLPPLHVLWIVNIVATSPQTHAKWWLVRVLVTSCFTNPKYSIQNDLSLGCFMMFRLVNHSDSAGESTSQATSHHAKRDAAGGCGSVPCQKGLQMIRWISECCGSPAKVRNWPVGVHWRAKWIFNVRCCKHSN